MGVGTQAASHAEPVEGTPAESPGVGAPWGAPGATHRVTASGAAGFDRSGFDRDAAQRVLRRAVALAERDLLAAPADLVPEQALLEAAEELGMDPGAVRRAAAEERLGVLVAASSAMDRLAGPSQVSATRVVDLPADQVMAVADQWLRRNGTLRRRRLDADGLVGDYARRSDPLAGAQRALRSLSGREQLGRVRRVRVVAQPIEAGRSVVALVADLEGERTVAVAGGASAAGAGSAFSVVEAVSSSPWWWAGVPASVAAGLGVVRWRARSVPDVELALQGVLDRVVDQDPSPGRLSGVTDRLRSTWVGGRRTA